MRFKEDDGEDRDEYEEVHFTEEEVNHILEENPRTSGGRLPWEPEQAAEKPQKSMLQRLTGR